MKFKLISLLILFILPFSALADVGSVPESLQGLRNNLLIALNRLSSDQDISKIRDIFWMFGSAFVLLKYAFHFWVKPNTAVLILVSFSYMLFWYFNNEIISLFNIVWSFQSTLGGNIQYALIGSDDILAAPNYIYRIILAMMIVEPGEFVMLDPARLMVIIHAFLLRVVIWLFVALAYVMIVGIEVTAIVVLVFGFVFLPMIFIPGFGSIFDGWIKVLIGLCFNSVLVKIILSVAVMLMASFYGIDLSSVSPQNPIDPILISLQFSRDLYLLFIVFGICAFMLFKANNLANSFLAGKSFDVGSDLAKAATIQSLR